MLTDVVRVNGKKGERKRSVIPFVLSGSVGVSLRFNIWFIQNIKNLLSVPKRKGSIKKSLGVSLSIHIWFNI